MPCSHGYAATLTENNHTDMRYRYSTEEDGRLVKRAVVYTRNEHGINPEDIDSEAKSIIQRLKSSGYESYIVGGAVRDLILKKKPKDFDIVSEASPLKIKKIFRNSRIIGRRFKLVHIYFGPRVFEVSTFRSLKDGLTSNTYGSVKDDVLRRDFTLNALLYDPQQQVVVDYVKGLKDIKAKRIRPIIPLSAIFKDDPVRMIRAVKYAAATGFTLPFSLKCKIKSQSKLLAAISPSRLTEEIFKIIHSPHAGRIVTALDKMGLYMYLQPNAVKLMQQRPSFRSRYLRSMAALNQPDEAIGTLINDYLEDITDWERSISENYKACLAAARSFLQPMNPPRFEVDHAIRRFFAAHGITIKKSHVIANVNQEKPQETASPNIDGKAHKYRKKRKKKQGAKEGEKSNGF